MAPRRMLELEGPSETFADGVGNLSFDGANFRIELVVTRSSKDEVGEMVLHKVPACRLVIPAPALHDLHRKLGEMFRDLQNRGENRDRLKN